MSLHRRNYKTAAQCRLCHTNGLAHEKSARGAEILMQGKRQRSAKALVSQVLPKRRVLMHTLRMSKSWPRKEKKRKEKKRKEKKRKEKKRKEKKRYCSGDWSERARN